MGEYEMNIIDKIASDFKLDNAYILRIVLRSGFYYRDFKIPKHNGGTRDLSQPSPELKALQYWVLNNILNKIEVSDASYAYKKGDSIKKNAELHSKSRFIFHTDIHNFFPSITTSHLNSVLFNRRDVFEDLGICDIEKSISYVDKICFRNGTLCIGAVSSPAISNIIMYSFDNLLLEYCKRNHYIYSRYADDIYISSNKYIDKDVVCFVRQKLKDCGFQINNSKTRFYSPKYQRRVTGVIITDKSQISIGTERRTKIKKMIYNKLIYNQGNPNEIIGYLSFLKDIEPNTYNRFIIKYSKYCKEDIIKALMK